MKRNAGEKTVFKKVLKCRCYTMVCNKKKIGTGKFEKVGMYCLLHILL